MAGTPVTLATESPSGPGVAAWGGSAVLLGPLGSPAQGLAASPPSRADPRLLRWEHNEALSSQTPPTGGFPALAEHKSNMTASKR